jgi:hypothetical protein
VGLFKPKRQPNKGEFMNSHVSTSKAVSQTRSLGEKASAYQIAGISLPEIAILGAAGYVLWRNRKKIETFLNDNGIDTPSFMSGDVNDLLQTGANLLSKNGKKAESSRH